MMNRQNQIKNFKSDRRWFLKNLRTIRRQYPKNHFAAIKNKKIIASAIELKKLKKRVFDLGEDPEEILIDLIYCKDCW